MSTIAIRNPIRCFCSVMAKRTNDNTYVCGNYKSGSMVCLFHLHHENLEIYYQIDKFPMPLDCEMCLATLKIHSKEYIAPCRITSVRCMCGDVATFYQSKKDNANNNEYFFGCQNWQTPKNCRLFHWAHKYRTVRNVQILQGLNSENEINSQQSHKNNNLNQNNGGEINKNNQDLQQKITCIICLEGERSHLITPCNHLCLCATCANQIKTDCPICRRPISSIQRIFLV